MAKKPSRVYQPGEAKPAVKAGAKPGVSGKPTVKTLRETETVVSKPTEQVYHDGTNKDRLSITHRAMEYAQRQKTRMGEVPRSKYDELLSCIYDSVLITDTNGITVEVNRRAEHHFKIEKQDLLGLNVVELISGADDALLQMIRKNVGDHRFTILEAICLRGDESRFPAEIVVNQLKGHEKGAFCFFIRDVTQRKKAEEELKTASDKLLEAEKVQARLDTLSTVFYELNNPLQILTCLAELDKNPEYKRQLDRIIEVLEHLRKEDTLEPIVDNDGRTRFDVPATVKLRDCDLTRVLVVDDEDMIRGMFVTGLKSAFPGLTIEPAADGKKAVEMFAKDRHGLLVMDVSMPVMNGEEAFAEIEKACKAKGWALPSFVFCTGFVVSEGLQEIMKNNPAFSCLKKPLSINGLIDIVKNHVVE